MHLVAGIPRVGIPLASFNASLSVLVFKTTLLFIYLCDDTPIKEEAKPKITHFFFFLSVLATLVHHLAMFLFSLLRPFGSVLFQFVW